MLDKLIVWGTIIASTYVIGRILINTKKAAKEQNTKVNYKYKAIQQVLEQIPHNNVFSLSAETLNEFYREPYKIENLENVTTEILEHCQYKGRAPKVRYTLLGNLDSKHNLNENRYYLTIGTDRHPSPDVILALLIHECMHLYIYDNQIKFIGITEEYATYILALQMGFYRQITRGISRNRNMSIIEIEELQNIISLNQ